MVYVIHVCWQPVSRSICSCLPAVSKPVWHIPLLCVQWKIRDDGQRNCPKHVEFCSKNEFEKLVHPVGFIIRNLSWCTVTWTSNTWSSVRRICYCWFPLWSLWTDRILCHLYTPLCRTPSILAHKKDYTDELY